MTEQRAGSRTEAVPRTGSCAAALGTAAHLDWRLPAGRTVRHGHYQVRRHPQLGRPRKETFVTPTTGTRFCGTMNEASRTVRVATDAPARRATASGFHELARTTCVERALRERRAQCADERPRRPPVQRAGADLTGRFRRVPCGEARGLRSTDGTVPSPELTATRQQHHRSTVAFAAWRTERGADHAA